MENEVLFQEVNNEVSTAVENNTPATEEKNEMSLGEAVIKLAVTGLAVTGAVTVGKKLVGGGKKLFGKLFSKKGKNETEDPCDCCFEEEE